MLTFLAISGSLRAASATTVWLKAIAALAPNDIHVVIYYGLATLPHFNPDLDIDPAPSTVADFRRQLREADAVIISSPEYAHGVPGSLKNALDWIVGSGEFMDKPTAVITASRARFARAALIETLTVMMAKLSDETSPTLASTTNQFDLAVALGTPNWVAALTQCLTTLAAQVNAKA